MLPWAIPLGEEVLISYPKIKKVTSAELNYPSDLEKACVDALCAVDYDRLNQNTERFLRYFTERTYPPEAIKKSATRFVLTIFSVTKEVNFQVYQNINEQNVLESISQATTFRELEYVIFNLLEQVIRDQKEEVGLVVRKAQRMVEEFYHCGITLEEIANGLGVTPEHVSAQFIKDKGINFSTYYRNYRLKKAKELLIGTDLKLYQIAGKVGYRDAKYFSKVFREAEGCLPAEYRQNHR